MMNSYRLLYLIKVAVAIPNVAFPFNSQVPPVARVAKEYQFTFSPTTFVPDRETFQYTLAGAPAWLSLNSASRTLSGIPGAADIGSPTFTIIASDGGGRASMQATIVVVRFEAPQIGRSISEALSKAGKMCGPRSVTVPPRSAFTVEFPVDTFKEVGKKVTYYSTLSDHTPLPGWLSFDPQSLRFHGSTPPLSSSPQQFEVFLIASDVPGFAGTLVAFTIVVSDHQFYFQDVERTVRVKYGDSVKIEELRSQLFLDGKLISDGDFANSTSDSPLWLSFEAHALSVNGRPPSTTKNQDVSVDAYDRFGDAANMILQIQVVSGLIVSKIDTVNATVGQKFSYTIDRSVLAQEDLKVTVDLSSASDWINFDPVTLILQGNVPSDLPAQIINGEITVSTPDGWHKESLPIAINVQATGMATSSISTRSVSSSTSFPTGGIFTTPGTPAQPNSKKRIGIIVGVVLAILSFIPCLTVGLVYCRSPRRGIVRTRSALKRTISRPVLADEDVWSAEVGRKQPDVEKGSEGYDHTPDKPPQIILNLSPEKGEGPSCQVGYSTMSPVKLGHGSAAKRSNNRMSIASCTINDGDALILDNINRTSWGYMGTSAHKQAHDSLKLASQMTRASRQLDNISPTPRRQLSRHMSYANRMSATNGIRNSFNRTPSGGIPIHPRLAGLGHGRSSLASHRNGMLEIIQLQQQCHIPSCDDTHDNRTSSGMSSIAPAPDSSRVYRHSSYVANQKQSMRDSVLFNSRRTSVQRPVPRRGQRFTIFSGGRSSRGSSSSGNRSSVLGLSTIDASPDLESDSPAAESSDALATPMEETIEKDSNGLISSAAAVSPLQRNPTQTSSKTTKTWKTSTTATTAPNSDSSGENASANAQTRPDPRPDLAPTSANSTDAHKRWSSTHLRTLVSRPFSAAPQGPTLSISARHSSIRDSALFASVDEDDIANDSCTDDDGLSMSFYFQKSTPVTSPTHRLPNRGKVPVGGVRVPPFSSEIETRGRSDSIMARPHPRTSFRKHSSNAGRAGSIRTPLRGVKDGANRVSDSGLGSSGTLGESGKMKRKGAVGEATVRLSSSKSRITDSVQNFDNAVSIHGRVENIRARDGSGSVAFL
jgi:hypothetical protein